MGYKSLTELIEFINKKKSLEEKFTHTSKDPAGSYYINEKDMNTFFQLYQNAIFDNPEKNNAVLSLTEKSGELSPLRIDLDFKFKKIEDINVINGKIKNIISEEFITDFIKIVIEVCKEMTSENILDFSPTLLYSIVLEKDPYEKDDFIKQGLHVHLPYFILPKNIMDISFRDTLLKKMCDIGILQEYFSLEIQENDELKTSSILLEPSEEQIIDKNIATKTWLLYGSAKERKMQYYEYRGLSFNEKIEKISLVDLFLQTLKKKKLPETEETVNFVLPNLLSIVDYFYVKQIDVKKKYIVVFEKKKKHKDTEEIKIKTPEMIEELYTESENLMTMLKFDRALRHDDRMKIGWILYSIGEGDHLFKDLWTEYCIAPLESNSDIEHRKKRCEFHWSQMNPSKMRFTIKSLHFIAIEDNPQDYNRKKMNELDIKVMKACDLKLGKQVREGLVADIIYEKYKDKFISAAFVHGKVSNGRWYEFQNHKWNLIEDNISLRRLIETEIIKTFEDKLTSIKQQNARLKEQEISDNEASIERDKQVSSTKEMAEKITNIIGLLNTVSFMDKIIISCSHKFYVKDFENKLNKNKKLFGCKNGVLDLETLEFREGKMDDFISVSSDINYRPFDLSCPEDREDYDFFMDYMKKLLDDEELIEYTINVCASCLESGNKYKNFVIFTGTKGNNGKSVFVKLLSYVFGSYLTSFPEALITHGNKTNSGAPSPEVIRLKYSKIAITHELDNTHAFDIQTIKKMTGNDTYYVRGMYDAGDEMIPLFTLFLACNEPPRVLKSDQAFKNRTKLIPFNAVFGDDFELSEFEQKKQRKFKIDHGIDEKLKNVAPFVLYYFFERYKIICQNIKEKKPHFIVPESVKVCTKDYEKRDDYHLEFCEDELVKTFSDKEKDYVLSKEILKSTTSKFISKQQLFSKYTQWVSINYPNIKKEGASDFMAKMAKHQVIAHPQKASRIYGWEFKPDDEDDENQEEEQN